VAIHEAVPRPETPEPSEKPSGLPRTCGPRNDALNRHPENLCCKSRKNRRECLRKYSNMVC
jgi:hypothetical protein